MSDVFQEFDLQELPTIDAVQMHRSEDDGVWRVALFSEGKIIGLATEAGFDEPERLDLVLDRPRRMITQQEAALMEETDAPNEHRGQERAG